MGDRRLRKYTEDFNLTLDKFVVPEAEHTEITPIVPSTRRDIVNDAGAAVA